MNFSPSDGLSGEPDLLSLSGQTMSRKLKSPRIWTEGIFKVSVNIHECVNEMIFTHDFFDESTFQMVLLMIYQHDIMS